MAQNRKAKPLAHMFFLGDLLDEKYQLNNLGVIGRRIGTALDESYSKGGVRPGTIIFDYPLDSRVIHPIHQGIDFVFPVKGFNVPIRSIELNVPLASDPSFLTDRLHRGSTFVYIASKYWSGKGASRLLSDILGESGWNVMSYSLQNLPSPPI
jgi:hypothetical protein